MYIVDPLKLKLSHLLSQGEANALNKARLRYGTDEDVSLLLQEVETAQKKAKEYFFVDFTPFERIGRASTIAAALGSIKGRPCPVIMVMSDALLVELQAETTKYRLVVSRFGDNGNLINVLGGNSRLRSLCVSLHHSGNSQSTRSDLEHLRLQYSNALLLELLFTERCVVYPEARMQARVLRNGTSFMRMPNGMLVSCYLNLKELGKSTASLMAVAYEALLALSRHFRRDRDYLSDFDAIIVPNNTALFLAATLQQMLEQKALIAIDRMGPIPTRYLHIQALIRQMEGRRAALLEEIVATGSEIDRSLLLLRSIQVEVARIIAFYNLEAGSPMLIDKAHVTSLCHPKHSLKYVYRSA